MAAIPTVVSMQALSLYPIQKVKLQFGGYNIKFSGNVPNGAKVRLLIGSYANFIDITPHYLTAHLPALLDVLAKNDYWAKQIPRTVDCSVAAYFGNDMIPGSQSGVQPLPCPVKPVEVDHIGTIAALSELGDVTPSLNYVKDGPGFGRILTKPIDGRYYFALASILETDPGNRGFDCTTFVGSALGRHDGMGGNSAEFANSVGGDGGAPEECAYQRHSRVHGGESRRRLPHVQLPPHRDLDQWRRAGVQHTQGPARLPRN
jgi:hypothetical protein